MQELDIDLPNAKLAYTMRYTKPLVLIGAFLFFTTITFSQTELVGAAKPVAIKVAECGKGVSNTDLKQLIEKFDDKTNEDQSAIGYIIIYGTVAYIKKLRARIVADLSLRKYDTARIVFIDGNAKGKARAEFWIVPAGADQPKVEQ